MNFPDWLTPELIGSGLATIVGVWILNVIRAQTQAQKDVISSMKSFMDIFKVDEVKKYVEIRIETIQKENEKKLDELEIESKKQVDDLQKQIDFVNDYGLKFFQALEVFPSKSTSQSQEVQSAFIEILTLVRDTAARLVEKHSNTTTEKGELQEDLKKLQEFLDTSLNQLKERFSELNEKYKSHLSKADEFFKELDEVKKE